jgi:hypothetical protein
LFFNKERANLTERDMLPRTVGYCELGPLDAEVRAANPAALAAAAALIARPLPVARPLFSLASEESLSDSRMGSFDSVDLNSTIYESLEMSVFSNSSEFSGPFFLSFWAV